MNTLDTAQGALLSQAPQLTAAQSAKVIRHVANALAGVAMMAAVAAQPGYAQVIPGGGGGGGGGALTGITALGNTVNSSSGAPAASQLSFSGSGAASVGLSGGTVLIDAPSGNGSSFNASVIGNTTGATSSQTGTITAQVTSGAGIVSVGFSSGTVIISATAPAASGTANNAVALGNTTAATSSSILTLTAVSLSGAGGVSIGFSTTGAGAGVIVVSGPGASGTANSVVLAGNTTALSSSGVVTLGSMSISGAGGNSVGMSNGTLVISGATGGAAGGTISYTDLVSGSVFTDVTTSSVGTMVVAPMRLNSALTMNYVALNGALLTQSSAAFTMTNVSTTSATASGSHGNTISLVLYSQETGISSNSFSSAVSTTASWGVTYSLSGTWGVNSSQKTLSDTISYSWNQGTAAATQSYSSTQSTSSTLWSPFIANASSSNFVGSRFRLDIPMATSVPAGMYLLGFVQSYASGTATGSSIIKFATDSLSMAWSLQGWGIANSWSGFSNVQIGTSSNSLPYQGFGYTSSSNSAAPATINWTGLSTSAAYGGIPAFQMGIS